MIPEGTSVADVLVAGIAGAIVLFAIYVAMAVSL